MSISAAQIKNLKAAVSAGLRSFYRPPMLTCSQYADEHFYMSSESSYTEGKWESLPFQIGILNAMGNDQISTLNLMKSARVGYTKMLMANAAYKIEHKKRNVLIYQPRDGQAKTFMKKHVETAIRDIPVWRALAPWMGRKHKDSTLEDKIFTNGKTLMVRGGTAAANYREISTDDVIYDELAGFDESIEHEGNATSLGDTRIELSMFPKSIRGSTPKVLGTCQIEKACSESPHYFRFNLPCPHCDELQDLKWGGPEEPFGIKWHKNAKGEHDPSTAYYLCEHCGCCIENNQLDDMELHPSAIWICENTGIRTGDFLDFYDADGSDITTPPNISIHIWSAYNSLNSWAKLVTEFFKAKGDKEKLQTFVNTKLGQPWDNDNGERLEWEDLAKRREMYPSGKVPNWVVYLTAGIDTQDDRYEGRIWGWGAGKEAALIDRFILYGDPASQVLKDKVAERIAKSYARADGVVLNIGVAGWDSGGHYTDDVYAMSKKLGLMRVIPLKGANVYGKPIANFPRKRTAKGVYLTEVGTDNAKELLMSMLRIAPDVDVRKPGAIHFPLNEAVCDDVELQQLTSERKVPVRDKGRVIYKWSAGKRRNEALDCFVYALAALYIAIEKFGINLDKLSKVTPIAISSDQPKEPKPKAAKQANANAAYLNGGGGGSSGGWL
ncbi:phage terminase large subunit family protein [Shewanella sp. SW36]|uniref:phage terminase large subunit family protein n=1 Tax=unclassified Shewanella TaxID=196818 RepID=UPI0021D8626A|nr:MULTISPECIES: terminase gpA endonuclease subunit [unclassified Shewanella]MCU7976422.1 phage terminase large subunit family protein [Shewanella sp. SW36]MCU7991662.1 phage terminase large subunit family protein [Shewanella sp. SW1]MCU8053042.1 phage terminase large subunit family protein [Shewanella sp. SM43]